MPSGDPPKEIEAIRVAIDKALNSQDDEDRTVGNAKHGVYAFYDYDDEPIYVGQTRESLRTRIRRHLTNQRTDAVAMSVLDVFEVSDIEMWPFWNLDHESVTSTLDAAEYTVFQKLLEQSEFSAVLNEKEPPARVAIELPPSHRFRIVPAVVYQRRQHADIRIARRASTIARLAQRISERSVQHGLRRTLLTQARRLEHLAHTRLKDLEDSN